MRPWVRVKLNPGSGRGRVPLDPGMMTFLDISEGLAPTSEEFRVQRKLQCRHHSDAKVGTLFSWKDKVGTETSICNSDHKGDKLLITLKSSFWGHAGDPDAYGEKLDSRPSGRKNSPMKYMGCSKCNATDRGQQLQAPGSLRSRERQAHAGLLAGWELCSCRDRCAARTAACGSQRAGAGETPRGRAPALATATVITAWGRCQPSVLNGRRKPGVFGSVPEPAGGKGRRFSVDILASRENRSPRVHVSLPGAGSGASRGGRERRPAVASTRGHVRGESGRRREGPTSGRGGGGGKGEEEERRALAGLPASSRRRPGPQATAPRPRADAGRIAPAAPTTDSSGSPSSLWEEGAGHPAFPLSDFRRLLDNSVANRPPDLQPKYRISGPV
ncbi:hypothetical protein QTO34_002167 [Cnephaeus nilssonii]|uniref:Uncharacterized protein n=1 Tax=Cnephaeus nilssonii TaxID=3371016 RepID=A0AA40HV94_CNENI|nr:hypothetical protein QTO34_002167 [Eptesicus nilssonii]